MTYLPEDLTIEILLKIPVKPLTRFKCVCRLWYNLISSHDFIFMHRETCLKKSFSAYCYSSKFCIGHPPTTAVSFKFDDVSMDLTIPSQVQNLKIVDCAEGVVCLSLSSRENKFVLWNPVTRQISSMINSSRTKQYPLGLRAGLYYDPVVNSYKVARVIFSVEYHRKYEEWSMFAGVGIFSLKDSLWKNLCFRIPLPMTEFFRGGGYISPVVRVKRYMYWIIGSPKLSITYQSYILRFDIADESFNPIPMPQFGNNGAFGVLASHKESLAMFVHQTPKKGTDTDLRDSVSSVDIWVMNDCDGTDQWWSKVLTCSPRVNITRALGFFSKDGVDWIVMNAGKDRLLYNPYTGEAKKFSESDEEVQFFSYSESLLSTTVSLTD